MFDLVRFWQMSRSSFIFSRPEETRPFRDRKLSIGDVIKSFYILYIEMPELLLVIKLQ